MRASMLCFTLSLLFAGCSDSLRGAQTGEVTLQAARTLHAAAPCPDRAIFVRRYGEIRGYPLDANGETTRCAVISGPDSYVSTGLPYGYMAIGPDGDLHALSFQGKDTRVLTIDAPNANGDASPSRLVALSPDAVALAVGSDSNDYIVAGENYSSQNCWYVVPSGSRTPSRSNCDTNLSSIEAMAAAGEDLVIAGIDAVTGAVRFDVVSNPAQASYRVARTFGGSENTIQPNATIALAVAPKSKDIYVFSRSSGTPASVTIFSRNAEGNAEPNKIIVGSSAELPLSTFAVDVLAVDDAGYLYVSTVTGTIYVYGPGATGDAMPVRKITDAGAVSHSSAAGIAIRL